MGPVVANFAEEYAGKIKIGKVNTDAEPQLAKDYQVMSIPNFVFIKDGKSSTRPSVPYRPMP